MRAAKTPAGTGGAAPAGAPKLAARVGAGGGVFDAAAGPGGFCGAAAAGCAGAARLGVPPSAGRGRVRRQALSSQTEKSREDKQAWDKK